MPDTLSDYTPSIISFLKKDGYEIERDKKLKNNIIAEIHATKTSFNLPKAKLLTSFEYLFFHYINAKKLSATDIKQIHDEERNYVNSLFKVPRALRLKVPNIVSVFISPEAFSEEQIAYAQKNTHYDNIWGGEKHSVHLIDIQSKKIHSQEINSVSVIKGGTFRFGTLDPTNRLKAYIYELANKIWRIPLSFN